MCIDLELLTVIFSNVEFLWFSSVVILWLTDLYHHHLVEIAARNDGLVLGLQGVVYLTLWVFGLTYVLTPPFSHPLTQSSSFTLPSLWRGTLILLSSLPHPDTPAPPYCPFCPELVPIIMFTSRLLSKAQNLFRLKREPVSPYQKLLGCIWPEA